MPNIKTVRLSHPSPAWAFFILVGLNRWSFFLTKEERKEKKEESSRGGCLSLLLKPILNIITAILYLRYEGLFLQKGKTWKLITRNLVETNNIWELIKAQISGELFEDEEMDLNTFVNAESRSAALWTIYRAVGKGNAVQPWVRVDESAGVLSKRIRAKAANNTKAVSDSGYQAGLKKDAKRILVEQKVDEMRKERNEKGP